MSIAIDTTEILPLDWSQWAITNLIRGVPKVNIVQTLSDRGFSKPQIESAFYANVKIGENSSTKDIRKLSDSVKEWVGSILLQNTDEGEVTKLLLKQGYSQAEILLEIETACKNPYLKAGVKTNKLLRKREWLLNTCDDLANLARLDPSYNQQIDVIDTPPFEVFIKEYYSKHRPVVLKKGIDHWLAFEKWSPQYFLNTLGDKEIEVQFDRESDALFERYSDRHRKSMLMSDFIRMIETGGESNNYYMTANNTKKNIAAIRSVLKDTGDFGEGYRNLIGDPASNTFFWMGPKGTFTPIHHDLTNNMLVQVYGSKKVTLIPAWQVPWIYNDAHVFSEVNFPEVDLKNHPLMQNVTPIEVTFEAGDALFIPIAWWHCVDGLETSISISFTNFNAPNNYAKSFKSAQV